MKKTLTANGISFSIFEVDAIANPRTAQDYLVQRTGISTIPILFVKGQTVGGCTDIKLIEHNGELRSLFAPFIEAKKENSSAHIPNLGLLWYPEVVDSNAIRLTSCLTFIYAIFCIGFYDHRPTQWVVLALAIDYLIRVIYGEAVSLLGAIATLLLCRSTPNYTCGAPRQFAASCNLLLTTLAAALFISGEGQIGGNIVLAAVVVTTGLEGITGTHTTGCYLFHWAIKLGIIPTSVYSPYLNLLAAKQWEYDYNNNNNSNDNSNDHHKEGNNTVPSNNRQQNEHVLLPGQISTTPVDLIRKNRTEADKHNSHTLTMMDVIYKTRIDFFVFPMTIAALAYMFLVSDNNAQGNHSDMGRHSEISFATSKVIIVISNLLDTIIVSYHDHGFTCITICLARYIILSMLPPRLYLCSC